MGKRILLFVILCFAQIPFSFADIIVYFKDGSSRKVHKIVFGGQTAELYTPDGRTITVATESIDMELTKLSDPAPAEPRKPRAAQGDLKQSELQREWENAEEVSRAEKNFGPIRRGDTVHISRVSYSKTTYYSVVFRYPDGTFGKRLFDAGSLASTFPTLRPNTESTPLVSPVTPESGKSESLQQHQLPPIQTEVPAPPLDLSILDPPKPVVKEKKSFPLPFAFGGAALVGIVVAALLLKKKKRPTYLVDMDKLRDYEEHSLERDIVMLLKQWITMEEVLQTCFQVLYRDNPPALNIANKILKGIPRNQMIPYIMRQGGMKSAEAEVLYNDYRQRYDRVKQMIQNVSQRTGLKPLPEYNEQKPAVPASGAGVQQAPMPEPMGSLDVQEATDVPTMFVNVLTTLSDLMSSEGKQ